MFLFCVPTDPASFRLHSGPRSRLFHSKQLGAGSAALSPRRPFCQRPGSRSVHGGRKALGVADGDTSDHKGRVGCGRHTCCRRGWQAPRAPCPAFSARLQRHRPADEFSRPAPVSPVGPRAPAACGPRPSTRTEPAPGRPRGTGAEMTDTFSPHLPRCASGAGCSGAKTCLSPRFQVHLGLSFPISECREAKAPCH